MAQQPRRPMRFFIIKEFLLSRTSWRTQVGSRCRTLNGCRIGWATFGERVWLTRDCRTRWWPVSTISAVMPTPIRWIREPPPTCWPLIVWPTIRGCEGFTRDRKNITIRSLSREKVLISGYGNARLRRYLLLAGTAWGQRPKRWRASSEMIVDSGASFAYNVALDY